MRASIKKVVRGSALTCVSVFLLQCPGIAISYDGGAFNSLFDKGKISEAMALIKEQDKRSIDSWRLARGHAALGDCSKALDLLKEAEQASEGRINFIRRPGDFQKLRSMCLSMLDDGAEPRVINIRPPVQIGQMKEPAAVVRSGIDIGVFGTIIFFFAATSLLIHQTRSRQSRKNTQTFGPEVNLKIIQPAATSAMAQLTKSLVNVQRPSTNAQNADKGTAAKTSLRKSSEAAHTAEFPAQTPVSNFQVRKSHTDKPASVTFATPEKSIPLTAPFDASKLAGRKALKKLEK